LETYCYSVDGALPIVSTFLVEVIDYSLNFDKIEDVPNDRYTYLLKMADTLFLRKTDSAVRVETALVALTAIGYLVVKRDD